MSAVFISYAGADLGAAREVAAALAAAGATARLAADEVAGGMDFVGFIDEALATSDHCLLLWSDAAAGRAWVEAEWHAALARTVEEHRAFLVVARLEDAPVPPLLRPRVFVDLFPDRAAGLTRLVARLTADAGAARATGRPVVPARDPPVPEARLDAAGDEVYVTSDLFAFTVPVRFDLDRPAGVALDALILRLGLPGTFHHRGRLSVRFDYALVHGERVLSRAAAARAQGVAAGDVLALQMTMTTGAAVAPVRGARGRPVFRGGEDDPAAARAAARTGWEAVARGMGLR